MFADFWAWKTPTRKKEDDERISRFKIREEMRGFQTSVREFVEPKETEFQVGKFNGLIDEFVSGQEINHELTNFQSMTDRFVAEREQERTEEIDGELGLFQAKVKDFIAERVEEVGLNRPDVQRAAGDVLASVVRPVENPPRTTETALQAPGTFGEALQTSAQFSADTEAQRQQALQTGSPVFDALSSSAEAAGFVGKQAFNRVFETGELAGTSVFNALRPTSHFERAGVIPGEPPDVLGDFLTAGKGVVGGDDEIKAVHDRLAEFGIGERIIGDILFSPINFLPIFGFTKFDDFADGARAFGRGLKGVAESENGQKFLQGAMKLSKGERGGSRGVFGVGGEADEVTNVKAAFDDALTQKRITAPAQIGPTEEAVIQAGMTQKWEDFLSAWRPAQARLEAGRSAELSSRVGEMVATRDALVTGGMDFQEATRRASTELKGEMGRLDIPQISWTPEEIALQNLRLAEELPFQQLRGSNAIASISNAATDVTEGAAARVQTLIRSDKALLDRIMGAGFSDSVDEMMDLHRTLVKELGSDYPTKIIIEPQGTNLAGGVRAAARVIEQQPSAVRQATGTGVTGVPAARRTAPIPEPADIAGIEKAEFEQSILDFVHSDIDQTPQNIVLSGTDRIKAVNDVRDQLVERGIVADRAHAEVMANDIVPRKIKPGISQAEKDAELLQRISFPDIEDTGLPAGRGNIITGAADTRNIPERFLDAWKLPQQLKQAFDISFHLRQGIMATARNPKEVWESFKWDINAWKGEAQALQMDSALRNDPRKLTVRTADGLRETTWGQATQDFMDILRDLPGRRGGKPGVAEDELLMSQIADKVPGVVQSERGFITGGNKMRSDLTWKWIQSTLQREGSVSAERLAAVSDVAGRLTGKGFLPGGRFGDVLKAVFWAPGYRAAGVEAFNNILPPLRIKGRQVLGQADPVARRAAQENIATWLASGMTALAAANEIPGVTVGIVPGRSDFGKIQVGFTSFNIWGTDLVLAQAIARGSGLFGAENRWGVEFDSSFGREVLNYAKSGLDPIISTGLQAGTGETVTGRPIDVGITGSGFDWKDMEFLILDQLPLVMQDVIDIWTNDGPLQAIFSAPLIALGIGATSYGGSEGLSGAHSAIPEWQMTPEKMADDVKAETFFSQFLQGKNLDANEINEVFDLWEHVKSTLNEAKRKGLIGEGNVGLDENGELTGTEVDRNKLIFSVGQEAGFSERVINSAQFFGSAGSGNAKRYRNFEWLEFIGQHEGVLRQEKPRLFEKGYVNTFLAERDRFYRDNPDTETRTIVPEVIR